MRRGKALAAGVLLLAAGCRPGSGSAVFPRAPVVLISIDTLRSDHLPMYGYRKVETPALDRLRADAILCESAFSHYPMTLPSHTSILSGELPPEHGVRDNTGYHFDAARHPYLPRLLKQAGYDTGAAVSSYVLRGATGLSQGFDFYQDSLHASEDQSLDAVQRPGKETVRIALDWVRQRAGRPFFLFLHLYEPHFPYQPPEPFLSRYPEHYDGEIATADAAVGDFLDELKRLGIYDRAVVVLLSDHGEGLGDHGEYQHSIFLYREALQVPLLVKLPGARFAGRTVKAVAQLVDVVPTVLALVGVAPPPHLPGSSIVDLLQAKSPPARAVYAETFYPRLHFGWSELSSLVRGPLHYIEGPDPELYDRLADPAERANVLAANRRAYAGMRQEVRARRRPLVAPGAVDADTRQKLTSLGYLAGGSVAASGPLPDPKSRRALLRLLEDAYARSAAGDHQGAVELFRRALAEDPRMVDIWGLLAYSYRKLGKKQEAVAAYEKALQLSGSPQLAAGAAVMLLEAGRLDEAEKHAELALKADPQRAYEILVRAALARGDVLRARDLTRQAIAAGVDREVLRREVGLALAESGRTQEAIDLLAPLAATGEPATLDALAIAFSDAGRQQEALALLERAVAKAPDNAQIHQQLGIVTLRLERPEEARSHLRRALALNAKLPNSWNTLGVALYRLEGPAAALDAWEKAVALDARQYDALYNIGLVAANAGRRDEARKALRRFVDTAPRERFGPDIAKARNLLKEIGG
jgi:choline-sulfatase